MNMQELKSIMTELNLVGYKNRLIVEAFSKLTGRKTTLIALLKEDGSFYVGGIKNSASDIEIVGAIGDESAKNAQILKNKSLLKIS